MKKKIKLPSNSKIAQAARDVIEDIKRDAEAKKNK
jgi:hypothetical protein